MEIRVTVGGGGEAVVESISILEDLWHDYRYFRSRACSEEDNYEPISRLLAKRYRRAALMSLMCYFEGVVNHWLKERLPAEEWARVRGSFEPLDRKIGRVEKLAANEVLSPDLKSAKDLRNCLAHLKPGVDSRLYDGITSDLLEETEAKISLWLSAVEERLAVKRHPDTRQESKPLREALGSVDPSFEGYSGGNE